MVRRPGTTWTLGLHPQRLGAMEQNSTAGRREHWDTCRPSFSCKVRPIRYLWLFIPSTALVIRVCKAVTIGCGATTQSVAKLLVWCSPLPLVLITTVLWSAELLLWYNALPDHLQGSCGCAGECRLNLGQADAADCLLARALWLVYQDQSKEAPGSPTMIDGSSRALDRGPLLLSLPPWDEAAVLLRRSQLLIRQHLEGTGSLSCVPSKIRGAVLAQDEAGQQLLSWLHRAYALCQGTPPLLREVSTMGVTLGANDACPEMQPISLAVTKSGCESSTCLS